MKTELKQKIDSLIAEHPILLFMKGSKDRPQCGFSKEVVGILNQLVPFHTVDILADLELREGIKVYSSWPTIPQLYVHGEFIGGCDIVVDLFQKHELQEVLKLEKAAFAPKINISDKAQTAFLNAAKEQEEPIRLSIASNFEHSLTFDQQGPKDFLLSFGEVKLVIDPYSALRADNLEIDFVEDNLEAGFAFKNPNEPPMVKEISAEELKDWHESGRELLLVDVRPINEASLATISFAKHMSEVSESKLDKDKAIVFHCHLGGRSRQMAEKFRMKGFKNLYNLVGGIDAWSKRIDQSVPSY